MKTKMKINSLLIVFLFSFAFISCEDEEPIAPEPPVTEGETELVGELADDRTLNPELEYSLTGVYSVESGATLTIPAGTKIVAENGQAVYIAVQQGGNIEVLGTAEKPVVMTSENGNPGDWGGLVILGEAKTTEGVDVIAEVGQLVYGGTDNSDSSGSINYLVINGAGAQIKADSQYNGLSLYSVGSGTSIQNVALRNGADDGVEFFGGTVSVSNLYLENNEDDAVDWTEGWSGTLTNTYVLNSIENFSTALEADGVNNNPKIVNFTAVSETGGTALQFKKESGATITGLSLTGYETTVDMKDDGPLENVQIEGNAADPENTYQNEATMDAATFEWVK